jgi:DHA3 family macrolide efflux protein-like MFS transporter
MEEKLTEKKPTENTFQSYLFFWSGQLFSLLGSSVVQFAIVWWVTVETGDPVYLSIAAFLSSLPMIFIGPLAGVYIDRLNRKIIILVTDFLQAAITFWLILIFLFDIAAVWPVILINSLRGLFQAFHVPAINAIIPVMIPKKHLSRMNAINYLFTGLIQSMGPFIGATLFELFNNQIVLVLWVDIVTFIIAFIPLILIKIPKVTIYKEKRSFFRDFSLGLKTLKKVPGLLILLIHISIINLLGVPFFTLLTLYIREIHSGQAFDYAFVNLLIQTGMISGSLIAVFKDNWKHKVATILISIIIASSGYLTATLAPLGFFLIIGIGGMVRAAMVPIINTNFLTIIQTNVDKQIQGRVMGIVFAIASAVSPIGMIVSGPLAKVMGMKILFFFCALLQIVSVGIVWFFTSVKHVRYEE